MNRGVRNDIIRIIIGTILYAASFIFTLSIGWGMHGDPPWEDLHTLLKIAFFAPAYIVLGGKMLVDSAISIARGNIFSEDFLMSIATLGAFALGECFEGCAVMLFAQVGELFEHIAVNRSRKSITDLMDIRPDYANLVVDGVEKKVDPYEVDINDTIIVKPGEKVPMDGIVIKGSSMLDTKALTGESVPRSVREGDEILSGCINTNGLLTVQVTKLFEESTASKILDMVENASAKKSHTESFIAKFAKYYTPIVCIAAVLIAIIPPFVWIISGNSPWGNSGLWMMWVRTALSFLVVSCPCALVISVPLSFFGSIGAASKMGILIKGSNYLEAMSKADTVVFDKTGTLTKGVFNVTNISPVGISREELIEYAAYAEGNSTHPIGVSLRAAYGKELDKSRIKSVEEIAGRGLKVDVNGDTVLAGNKGLLDDLNIQSENVEEIGTVVFVAVNNRYVGYIVISDEIKADSKACIEELRQSGVKKTYMLTGDREATAEAVAGKLGIDEVYSQLLPGDKLDRVEDIIAKEQEGGKVVYVGDGINDAPVLARADIGVAMGGLGSDAAIEAADIVIMTDEISKLPAMKRLSKATLAIVYQNIVFAIGVKTLTQILSVSQLIGSWILWVAVFADVGVSIIAILNSMRMLRYNDKK